jgi:hypothetical protein
MPRAKARVIVWSRGRKGRRPCREAALPARHTEADFRPGDHAKGFPGLPHIKVGRGAADKRVTGCGQRAGHSFQAPANPWAQRRAAKVHPQGDPHPGVCFVRCLQRG